MTIGRHSFSALLGGLLALLPIVPAHASGDICMPQWKLDPGTMLECTNIAALAPGNDTRVNLLLLLFDRHGIAKQQPQDPALTPVFAWRDYRDSYSAEAPANPPDFASGEGSRCRTDKAGAAAFETAVKAASGLSPEEQDALLKTRTGFKLNCAQDNTVSLDVEGLVQNAKSKTAKAFATYLRGAAFFYGGQFDDALKDFESLKDIESSKDSGDAWLTDTADYMAARTLVNRLQVNAFDEYGTFKGSASVDQAVAKRAEASLENYLKIHANGRYVGSAKGLQRRVDWLAGWYDKLASQYATLLVQPASSRGIDDVSLVNEIDSKLLSDLTPSMTTDPILLAVLDLQAMRKKSNPDPKATASRVDLDAQKDAFASAPSLYELLKASAAFYGDSASTTVLKTLPDDTRRRDGDYLWFSRQFLRGQALEATGDRNTRGFWKELFPGATRPLDQGLVELALALHEERHGELQDVFAAGSLVTNSTMRNILLENIAAPALLRTQAHDPSASERDRRLALFTLLYKEVTRERYADFLTDLASVPADATNNRNIAPDPAGTDDPPLGIFAKGKSAGDIACPVLSVTVTHLAQDPHVLRDRLCLAEFVRLNAMDQSPLDKQPPKDELGGSPTLFPGAPYGRGTTYLAVIDDKQASPAEKAYALYRAVKCYEPTGNNECGGTDQPKAKRKIWYNTLKHDYPSTRWAKELQYWW